MGRTLRLGWFELARMYVSPALIIMSCVAFAIAATDPLYSYQGESAGTVIGEQCVAPYKYRNGRCFQLVRLDDGREFSVAGTWPGRQYRPGQRVNLLRYKTWIHRHEFYEFQQAFP